jgi:hypothetical protein
VGGAGRSHPFRLISDDTDKATISTNIENLSSIIASLRDTSALEDNGIGLKLPHIAGSIHLHGRCTFTPLTDRISRFTQPKHSPIIFGPLPIARSELLG